MNIKSITLHTALIVFCISVFVTTSFATSQSQNETSEYPDSPITIPTFPSCINPQGTLISEYAAGIHGVPGDSTTYTGHDAVYSLTKDTLTQCLCTTEGVGIQTNWWKVKHLNLEQIKQYVSEGWTYIPDGSAWGLEHKPYLTKNVSYTCVGGKGGTSGGGSNGSSGGDGGSSSSGSNNSSNGSSEGSNSNSVSSGLSQVLGLASTGNIATVYALFIFGILTTLLAIILEKRDSLRSRA